MNPPLTLGDKTDVMSIVPTQLTRHQICWVTSTEPRVEVVVAQ